MASPGALGELAPLLAFGPPIQQIRAGEHEPIAVVAVEVPRASAGVDDRVEGAEPARGGRGAPRQVDHQRVGQVEQVDRDVAAHRCQTPACAQRQFLVGVEGDALGVVLPSLVDLALQLGLNGSQGLLITREVHSPAYMPAHRTG